MKKLSIVFIILLSFYFTEATHSQHIEKFSDSSKVYLLRGKVIDDENIPVVFAHIINKRRGLATVTDSLGFFKIMAVNKDSIKISAIGFQTKTIAASIKNDKDTSVRIIQVAKKTYDIATVNIYEVRWQVFKSEMMETKIEEDQTAARISNWMAHLVPSDELKMIFQSGRGIGFNINYKSKAEKSRKKVAEMEKKYQVIAPKFNDNLITEVTGLQGKDIYPFVKFCNFEEDFLMQATEYEIMEKIIELWDEYQKINLQKKKKK